ncbi:hypothetical protein GCM10025868_40980 [Angustibacter aerolatus]|uniref:Amine oxidase domain-containing protein n=1 Tax=Angustibacter aerolatus TaxID=1162965 RepID=A0ABQ6JN96_9ACTN|nr:FAD/NAD(P)-binding protein [Angustibacter aerolatus]GMA88848.1 hypothetical protein GCM10025868_40980 [Angustibacter aerolatus]
MDPVIVVGAGISGVTCARELDRAGLPVRVLDRGRRIGGRMALQRTGSRVVDTGASYLTASDDAFTEPGRRLAGARPRPALDLEPGDPRRRRARPGEGRPDALGRAPGPALAGRRPRPRAARRERTHRAARRRPRR